MGTNVAEASRQSFIVMKNEIKKYFSGKRMLVFAVLLFIILFVITIAPYMFHKETDPMYYYMMAALVVLMAATLFGSISIVSEYEERTALIVFTRPIRKTSIFLGKAAACLILTIAFTAIYYAVAAIVSQILKGSVSPDLIVSFGLSCAYAVGTIGVAMLVSSLMKKGSTSTIITFVVLAIIVTAVSLVLNAANVDSWWMIDQASGSIETCSSDYRDAMNESIQEIARTLMDPTKFIDMEKFVANLAVLGVPATADQLLMGIINPANCAWHLDALGGVIGDLSVKEPNYVRDTLVMIAWGVISMIGAFIVFLRREF